MDEFGSDRLNDIEAIWTSTLEDSGARLLEPETLTSVVELAEKRDFPGALAVTLLEKLRDHAGAKTVLASVSDALQRMAARAAERFDEASREPIQKAIEFDSSDWVRPTHELLRALCALAGVSVPELEIEPAPKTTGDASRHLLEALPARLSATRALTPLEEAARDETRRVPPQTSPDWMTRLAYRFAWPRLNAYWLWLHATRTHFARPHVGHRGRELAIAQALIEGWLAAGELAKRAGIDLPEPKPDPFAAAKRRGTAMASSEQEAFQKKAMQLGPLLLESDIGVWARESTRARMQSLGDVPERDAAERALADALATGVLIWFATYGARPEPLTGFLKRAEAAGAFKKVKKPSLAKIKKTHPPTACVPFRLLDTAPTAAGQSAANPTGEAACAWLAASDVPRDPESGKPMRFVAQIDLSELENFDPGARAALGGGNDFFALFQPDRGRGGSVVARTSAPTEGEIDARLRRIAFGRVRNEPPSPAWVRLLSPELFIGAQSEDDIETTLGAYREATDGKIVTSSKVGGSYAPVQGSFRLPDGTRSARMICALDFDHGARLPDAGLVYVFAIDKSDGTTEYCVHSEHA